jgi:hypothetical protein
MTIRAIVRPSSYSKLNKASGQVTKDWRLERLEGQEFLFGIRFRRIVYRQYRPGWDHDHCVGCWTQFAEHEDEHEPILREGYTTCSDFENGAEYWWACAECFGLFKGAMGWSEVANSS